MNRRRFIQSIAATSALGLSGCTKFNPLKETTPPTDAQLEYIEFYPHYSELNRTVRVTFERQEELAIIEPLTFGPFEEFELYSVQSDGNGEELENMTPENVKSGPESGTKAYQISTFQGGSVMLILGVTENNNRFTYGAFYYAEDEFKQVAYVDSTTTQSDTEQ